MNIIDVMIESCKKYSSRTLCTFMGSKLLYKEMKELIDKLTSGLQHIGVKKGTRIGIFLPNCPAFIISYYASLQAGGTVVNYSLLSSTDEICNQIRDAEIEFMITINMVDLYSKIEEIQKLPDVNFKIIVCSLFGSVSVIKDWIFWIKEYRKIASVQYGESIIKFSSLLGYGTDFKKVDIYGNDLALIQYSGGTTGKAKGVCLNHDNLLASIEISSSIFKQYEKKYGILTVISVLPLNHVFAMTLTMNSVIKYGLTSVLIPKFSIETILESIEKEKINVLVFVPTILSALIKSHKIQNYDLSSLKIIFCGGAPLTRLLYNESKKIFPKCNIFQGYGLSETLAIVSLNHKNYNLNPESVGYVLPKTKISVRSLKDDAIELAYNEVGEICVKGPQVMQSYLKLEDNIDVFIDGYFKTGDVGYLNKDGCIYIVDRIKDMILRRGYNIFPSEIENVIRNHEAIEDVAVIGIKNYKINEEIPKAIIKLKAEYRNLDTNQIRDSILEYCNGKLSNIKMPKILEFVDDLPKTPIGKIDKKKLKITEIEKVKKLT